MVAERVACAHARLERDRSPPPRAHAARGRAQDHQGGARGHRARPRRVDPARPPQRRARRDLGRLPADHPRGAARAAVLQHLRHVRLVGARHLQGRRARPRLGRDQRPGVVRVARVARRQEDDGRPDAGRALARAALRVRRRVRLSRRRHRQGRRRRRHRDERPAADDVHLPRSLLLEDERGDGRHDLRPVLRGPGEARREVRVLQRARRSPTCPRTAARSRRST